jgi:hypothetical protein
MVEVVVVAEVVVVVVGAVVVVAVVVVLVAAVVVDGGPVVVVTVSAESPHAATRRTRPSNADANRRFIDVSLLEPPRRAGDPRVIPQRSARGARPSRARSGSG